METGCYIFLNVSIDEERQSNFEDIGVARTSKFFTNLTATEIYWGGYLWNM